MMNLLPLSEFCEENKNWNFFLYLCYDFTYFFFILYSQFSFKWWICYPCLNNMRKTLTDKTMHTFFPPILLMKNFSYMRCYFANIFAVGTCNLIHYFSRFKMMIYSTDLFWQIIWWWKAIWKSVLKLLNKLANLKKLFFVVYTILFLLISKSSFLVLIQCSCTVVSRPGKIQQHCESLRILKLGNLSIQNSLQI